MARRVAHYLGAHLDRRNRCPDCDIYLTAVGNVEACSQCGQIVGPSMAFERKFLPDKPPRPESVPTRPGIGRAVVDVYEQGKLL